MLDKRREMHIRGILRNIARRLRRRRVLAEKVFGKRI